MSLRPSVGKLVHPALVEHAIRRRKNAHHRIADQITRFVGSMGFIYVSIVAFALWIGLGVEKFPYGLLTMIVSLEAILLTSFVLISQNRSDEKRQVLADNQWTIIQTEKAQNEQLIEVCQKILDLTTAIHGMTSTVASTSPTATSPSGPSTDPLPPGPTPAG
jgi:uncharacterized membrane protein